MPAAAPLIGAAVSAIGGWGVVAGVASFVASTALQRRAAAKARRRARRQAKDAAGVQARFTPSGEPVDIWYGHVGGYGVTVYAAPASSAAGYASEKVEGGRDVNRTQSPQQDGYRGLTNPGIKADNVETDYKQFLLTQTVLCVGEINSIVRFVINDVPVPGGQLDGTYLIEYSALRGPDGQVNFGSASPMAARWRPSQPTGGQSPFPLRTASDRFTDLTYITSIFFQGETQGGKEPQYGGGIPQIFAVAEGRLVRDIIKEEGAAAALSETRIFSNNVALVLLDYLSSDLPYGPRLPIEKIDLESFYRAKEKFGVAEWGPDAASDDTPLDPESVQAIGFDPETIKTLADYYRIQGFARGFNGVDFDTLPIYQGRGGGASRTPQARKRNVTYGEYNGVVPTLRDFEVAIDIILSVVPGTFLTLGLDGKYKLTFGDHEVTGEAGSVREIEESETLDGINELASTFDERVNQVKINFANQEKDFASDTVTFPRWNTTLHRRWMSEDGGRQLRDEDTIDGVSTVPQAQAVARMQASLSRRALFEFTLGKKHLDLEVGDIVTLNVFGRGVHARLEVVVPNEHLMVSCVAREYVRHDFRWWIDDSREIPGLLADRNEARRPEFRGLWAPGNYYVRGDSVIKHVQLLNSGVSTRLAAFWRCLRAHFSSLDNEPGSTGGNSYWTQDAALDTRRFDFIGDRIADVTFAQGVEIETFELPQATGFGLSEEEQAQIQYAVTALPDGLVFNPVPRHITGVPANVGSLTRVVYSASLPSTGETADRDFHITVRAKGSPLIPAYEITAVDVEVGVVLVDWQVLTNAASIQRWKYRVEYDKSSQIVAQGDLAGNDRRVTLNDEENVSEWDVGVYTVFLAAVMQDGVVTEYDSLSFLYFGDFLLLPPAPSLEITNTEHNELTATWDAPVVGDGERISRYEVRLRMGYNSYIYAKIDRRSPGSVEMDEWAPIEAVARSAVRDEDFTMTHIRDTTQWLRLGEQVQSPATADRDQQAQVSLVAFNTTTFAGGLFKIGDYIGVKIGNNWCQWVYNGWTDDTSGMNTGFRFNLQGTGTGAEWKPTVIGSKIDPDNQHVPLDSETFIQFQGNWLDANTLDETSETTGGVTTYTAPEPEFKFGGDVPSPATTLPDGIWGDVQYRYEVTNTETDDSAFSEWSQVATILMTDEAAKPPPPRNFMLEEAENLVANWDAHRRTTFTVSKYQVQWKMGDDDYPTKMEDGETVAAPQLEAAYDEDKEKYTVTVTSSPVEGTKYTAQARSVATLDEVPRGEPTEAFSDWTAEDSLIWGAGTNKLVGFNLATGDAEGEVKWTFPAPENMSAYDIEYRRSGDTIWIQLDEVSALTATSSRVNPVSDFAEGDTVSGKIGGLIPGVQYEATARYETFELEVR